ncbi:acetyl-CoA synthetase, partial [Roseivivax sediminis]
MTELPKTFSPSAATVSRAHVDEARYEEMYRRSVEDPEGFWA